MEKINQPTILIVEDNDLNFMLLAKILNILNLNFYRVKDGNEALQYCEKSNKIKIIFMDIMLPDFSGIELSEKIKQIIPNSKIIANTSLSEDDNIKNQIFDFIIYKPVKINEIKNILNNI